MKQSCNGSMVGSVDHGIRFADGDATVPLISLGALCRKHWRHKKLNPGGMRVVSREFPHGGKPGQRGEGTSRQVTLRSLSDRCLSPIRGICRS